MPKIQEHGRIQVVSKQQYALICEELGKGKSRKQVAEMFSLKRGTLNSIIYRANRFGFEIFNNAVYLEV